MTPEKTKIISLSNSSTTLKGYLYQVKDSIIASVVWWPVDNAYNASATGYGQWAEYSVLTKNYGNPVSIKSKGKLENIVKVFPNPTGGI